MLWRRAVEPFARPFVFAWFKLARGLTLGVRGIVLDEDGRVLLIEHTYVDGWHLPGGGVEKAETAETALARELVEEAGVRLTGAPKLVSIHSNHAHHPNDHVLTYLCPDWEPCRATSHGEIAQIGWFHPQALPETLRPGHRRRIEEALLGAEPAPLW